MPTWIEDLLRNLFFAIDNIVYYFITLLYELLMYLANIDIFGTNDDVISAFLRRVYAILGIFMLFKVSFSILQYIVDPNSFSDQSKGMGRLLRNVIVVLALLALTPSLFSLAFDLQSTILNSNIIGKLILGNSTGDAVSDDPEESINATLADDMRFLVFGSFFTVNYELIPECKDSPVLGTKAMASNTEGEGGNGTCLEQVRDLMDENFVDIYDFFRTSDTEDDRDFASFGSLTALSQDNKHYFDYQFGFSTIAGGVIVVMMLAYCFDVAVRIIKLFFLEIIAPIPIVSFVDPKQGKEGMLYRWAKECGSTYASLFIRLAIIFLAFFLIDLVASMNLATDKTLYYNEDVPEGVKAVLVQVMLVFGILIFANQAPKLIEEIFGFKSSGELGINPLKRISSSPFASAVAGGVAGSALTAASAFTNARSQGRGMVSSIKAAALGTGAGLVRGAKGAKEGNIMGGALSSAGKTARNIGLRRNTTLSSRVGARYRDLTGQQSKFELYQEHINTYDSIRDAKNKIEEEAKKEVGKNNANYRQLDAQKILLEQQLRNGAITKEDYTSQIDDIKKEQAKMVEKYINEEDNKTIAQYKQQIERTIKENKTLKGVSDMKADNWADIKDASKKSTNEINDIKTSDSYQDAEAMDKAIKSGQYQSWRKNQ